MFWSQKITKRFAFALVVLCSLLLLCACTNNIDTMINDYNGLFSIEEDTYTYTVDNVLAEDMLRPSYPVSYLTTLCLVAPAGGAIYTWTAEVYENANKDTKGESYTLGGDRVLSCYLKNSKISRWGTYKLTLTVQLKDGELMKDTAWLYVY